MHEKEFRIVTKPYELIGNLAIELINSVAS